MDVLIAVCRRTACSLIVPLIALTAMSTPIAVSTVTAQSANAPFWIWTPTQPAGRVPQGDCYFRKTISLPAKYSGYIEVAADDTYEVFVNGKEIGKGSSWEVFRHFDISTELKKGKNVIAIKVSNRNGSDAGLVGRIQLKSTTGSRTFITNPTWKCSTKVWPMWTSGGYRDTRWKASKSLGSWGVTEPWSTGGEKSSDADQDLADGVVPSVAPPAEIDTFEPAIQEANIAEAPSRPTETLPGS